LRQPTPLGARRPHDPAAEPSGAAVGQLDSAGLAGVGARDDDAALAAGGSSPMRRDPNRTERMAIVAAKAAASVAAKTIVAFATAGNGTSSNANCSHTSGA
jgi:hypothetical protein